MEIPAYQPFYIESVEALRMEIARLGLVIPLDEDLSPLAQPLVIGRRRISNRFCAQPIAGGDAGPDGAPGELTRRRYRRYAEGRFGLIWVELTAAGSTEKHGHLCLNGDTLAAFRAMVQEMRASAADNPTIVIQLASEQIDLLIHAAMLAAEAGFDGVDLQCSRDVLPEALAAVRERAPELLLTTRLCAYEAVRGGFGVSVADYRQPDLAEPIRFVQRLRENGLVLLNVTAASPSLRGSERGVRGRSDSENPDEHPLMTLDRQLRLACALRGAVPDLPVVGSGFSWLRQFVPQVAAGALRDGMIDFAGLGRGALAYPSAPAEIFAHSRMEPGSACMVCFACSQLREDGEPVGCVLRDPAAYGPVYRQMRRFDADQLLAGAARCHLCEAAPCVAASPTRTDIPAFIQAFRNGDESRAYEIIRARDPLPELTARLSPAWQECEGACIETTLSGTPVPILDLQYAIAWRARDRGQTGARVPPEATGQRVAVVGGGPAGIAAAIRLVELGHTVDLYEQADRLGGAPARVIPSDRLPNPRAEIEPLLQPALAAKRLQLRFGVTLGKELRLEELRADHEAVLLATGLWQEGSLGEAQGVVGSLAFLESSNHPLPDRVAVLAGGDGAMDAARLAQNRGAKEIFVIFGGPRSALHWHLPESWFATPGVQAMMNWQPVGYETDQGGQVCGVRLRHSELHLETVLPVGFVIEAMELQVADRIQAALGGETDRVYTAGALVNGGASVSHCVAEGLATADAIHRDISS
ncbi:MAG: glutamate synthase small chain [Chthoniobacter sp.]|jgi:NADPH-dependent glutamate synthase beta subunit-like oxidoreductase/2,4-dienoyl-CoA reductase-like NADH-dependent reductase (Old Yellow Enzyme family)|nr:glutamate synthase small chain [Chthoniobacter sp.]